jgi:hypothetical protein
MTALSWWKKSNVSQGSVLYPGPLPPPAAQFEQLRSLGFEIQELPVPLGMHWALHIGHPLWGQGVLSAHREPTLPPKVLFEQSMLSDDERALALRGETSVTLVMSGTGAIPRSCCPIG